MPSDFRFQVFPMDEGNDQWGVRDTHANMCWSDDGWQLPDSGLASVLTEVDAKSKAMELENTFFSQASLLDINIHQLSLNMDGAIVMVGSLPNEAQQKVIEKLNTTLQDAVHQSLNAGCLAIQNTLSVDDGGFAGLYYSGGEAIDQIRESFFGYMKSEIQILQAAALELLES